MSKLSKTKIVEKMKTAGGRFMTVEFIKKDGKKRKLNGRIYKDFFMDLQGYIIFDTVTKGFKKINPRSIISLSLNKTIYKAKNK